MGRKRENLNKVGWTSGGPGGTGATVEQAVGWESERVGGWKGGRKGGRAGG